MGEEVGFVTMAAQRVNDDTPELGLGMLGYGFICKGQPNGFKKLHSMVYPLLSVPTLIATAGDNEYAVQEAAQHYG